VPRLRLVLMVAVIALSGAAGTALSAGSRPLPGLMIGPAPWGPNDGSSLRPRLKAIGLHALSREGLRLHIHQHLDIVVNGRVLGGLPLGIGIDVHGRFISEIHTHDSSGIIHVESPTVRTFTLGEFFDVWGLRFSSRCLGGYCATKTKHIWVWVNGKRVRTDPRRIVLRSHQEIVVAYGTAASTKVPGPIPRSYPFPAGY
jgi:hypothetical protein